MFKITARTVLELGSELISSDIIAFYELIKNGFEVRVQTHWKAKTGHAAVHARFLKTLGQ